MLQSLTGSLVIVVWLTIPWLAYPPTGQSTTPLTPAPDLEIFSSAGCPRRSEARLSVSNLQRQRPTLHVVVHEVDKELQALARLKDLAA